jgi:hypothetical protein
VVAGPPLPLDRVVNWALVDDLVDMGVLVRQGQALQIPADKQGDAARWRTDSERPGLRLVPVATRRVIDVAGIQQDESDAQVQFRWHWELTKLGGALIASAPRSRELLSQKYTSADRVGSAYLRRWDDGWRVERITY